MLSPAEKSFLERTDRVWGEKSLFSQMQRSAKRAGGSLAGEWFRYYWGNETRVLYYRRIGNFIYGVEFNRVRLIADIIELLPDSVALDGAVNEKPADLNELEREEIGQIQLQDDGENVVYQWGQVYAADEVQPIVATRLFPPLYNWRLIFLMPSGFWERPYGISVLFTIVPGLSFTIIALLVLAVYFYREQTRELREASQRVNFVNQVSHELKTPLTNIRMYAELLQSRLDEDDEKARGHLSVIVSESQRLSRLIGNILTFGRKERGKLDVKRRMSSIVDVVQEVVEQFRPGLDENGIEVNVVHTSKELVAVDTDLFQQILGNLISNVKKYAAQGRYLGISTSIEDGVSTIRVQDKGPGIAPENREKVFQAFYRSSNKLTEGISGTGIGLSIARDLARLHGGELVLLESAEGSLFELRLATPDHLS
jgi:signal transduction histidine kinase